MENDFKVWSEIFAMNYHACPYYRVQVPLVNLQKQKFTTSMLSIIDKQNDRESSIKKLMYSDIFLNYCPDNSHAHDVIKNKKAAVDEFGKMQVPPAIVYDEDDNVDFIHPFAEEYAHRGTRTYPDGKLLEEGDTIMYEAPDGKIVPLWEDGKTKHGKIFNIKHNLMIIAMKHRIIKDSHGATCPSPALARYWKNVLGQSNVYVFPNTVDLSDYEFYNVNRRNDKIRILWQGGSSHYIDWWPLKDALKEIANKYKDKITFVMYGVKFGWILDAIPDSMIEYHDWTPYAAYRLKRGLLNIDINLCPLTDNPFNRCKSAIKWYEGSIWPTPEATLAQKTGPYLEITHNENGLLFSNPREFVEMLSSLIDDAALRKRLSMNAKKWVEDNRYPEKTIPGLFDFYLHTRNKQKRDLGLSPIKLISTV